MKAIAINSEIIPSNRFALWLINLIGIKNDDNSGMYDPTCKMIGSEAPLLIKLNENPKITAIKNTSGWDD